jgi:hypothetical protein
MIFHKVGKDVAMTFMSLNTASLCRAAKTGGHLEQLGAGGKMLIRKRAKNWLRCIEIGATVLSSLMAIPWIVENVFKITAFLGIVDSDEDGAPVFIDPLFFITFFFWYYTLYYGCLLTTKHINCAIDTIDGTSPREPSWREQVVTQLKTLCNDTLPLLSNGWGDGLLAVTLWSWLWSAALFCGFLQENWLSR